jgi:hypothetical protein
MELADKVKLISDLLGQHPQYALIVILLGFMGGTISGFIGTGGAFLMTPGMMNLGIPGIMAVGANITHKFGKAMMGQRRHAQLGHVDRALGLVLTITSLVGIRAAVVTNEYFFEKLGKDGSTLYVSSFFVVTLSVIGAFLLKDALRSARSKATGPSARLLKRLEKLRLPPVMYFKVANVHISLPLVIVIGFCTGFMAGTIGVGGFVGVPAMIYLFGVPTVVATGTELFLAMFMGAFGALNYAAEGYVDLRIVMLLYAGSLPGLYLGTVGTKLVRESYIRLVTALLVLLCVLSRALALPVSMRALAWIRLGPQAGAALEWASTALLFSSGAVATGLILYFVLRAHFRAIRVFRFYRPAVVERRAAAVVLKPACSK